jgi:hypothetical protein
MEALCQKFGFPGVFEVLDFDFGDLRIEYLALALD